MERLKGSEEDFVPPGGAKIPEDLQGANRAYLNHILASQMTAIMANLDFAARLEGQKQRGSILSGSEAEELEVSKKEIHELKSYILSAIHHLQNRFEIDLSQNLNLTVFLRKFAESIGADNFLLAYEFYDMALKNGILINAAR